MKKNKFTVVAKKKLKEFKLFIDGFKEIVLIIF